RKWVGYHRAAMGVEISVVPPGEVDADVVAVGIPEPATLAPELAAIDERLESSLRELLAAGEIRGELGESALVHLASGRVAAAGIGRRDRLDADAFRTAAAAVARAAERFGGTVGWVLDSSLPLPEAEQA